MAATGQGTGRGRAALAATPLEVAPLLLGRVLVSDLGGQRVCVRVTEVEAYGAEGDDPASHAFRGRTARNASMFGPPGHAYAYFTYGMHWCVNVVTGPEGVGTAVLLRAGEVVVGVETARQRRPAARREVDLARGPARLAAALGIDRGADGLDLLDPASPLRLEGGLRARGPEPSTGPRVGIRSATERPWRLWLPDEPTVSAFRAASPRNHVPTRSGDARG